MVSLAPSVEVTGCRGTVSLRNGSEAKLRGSLGPRLAPFYLKKLEQMQ